MSFARIPPQISAPFLDLTDTPVNTVVGDYTKQFGRPFYVGGAPSILFTRLDQSNEDGYTGIQLMWVTEPVVNAAGILTSANVVLQEYFQLRGDVNPVYGAANPGLQFIWPVRAPWLVILGTTGTGNATTPLVSITVAQSLSPPPPSGKLLAPRFFPGDIGGSTSVSVAAGASSVIPFPMMFGPVIVTFGATDLGYPNWQLLVESVNGIGATTIPIAAFDSDTEGPLLQKELVLPPIPTQWTIKNPILDTNAFEFSIAAVP